jgi:Ca2+-binding RTX toxin-like protein
MANITGTSGNDFLGGTGSADTISGLGGNDALSGGGGNDTIFGGDGNDTIFGGAGNDTIFTGSNDDIDRAWASLGNDRYNFAGSLPAPGSFAFHEIDYRLIGGSIDVNIGSAGGTVTKTADGSTDRLVNLQSDSSAWGFGITLTQGDDTVRISLSSGVFTQINALGGSDSIVGGSGFERLGYAISAVPGVRVVITGYSGDGSMQGRVTEGPGVVDRFSRIDEVQGSLTDDTFTGNTGNDRFIGDGGDNIIDGGAGYDVARYDRGGLDHITANLATGTVKHVWTSGFVRIGAWTDRVSGIEEIHGSDGDDRIFGGNAAERFRGQNGNDDLRGLGGNDTLEGENDNDRLQGGGGDDFLDGGSGTDTLRGDSGADGFAFEAGNGADTVLDFADGQDEIVVTGNFTFTDFNPTQVGADVLLTRGADTLLLRNFLVGNLSDADFNYI